MKKLVIGCLLLVVFGLLDCATTVVGIEFFGATESNPFLVSTTEANLVLFSAVKIVAVVLIGFLFYNAGKMAKSVGSRVQIGKYFFQLTYLLSLLVVAGAFANNIIVVAQLV